MVHSSAVQAVGWDDDRHAYVLFAARGLYRFDGVPRQRVVACARARSVGQYVNREIIPRFQAWQIVARPEQLELGVTGGRD
jgi:hypothetical protein